MGSLSSLPMTLSLKRALSKPVILIWEIFYAQKGVSISPHREQYGIVFWYFKAYIYPQIAME